MAFSEDTCLEKERVRSKVTPRKVGVELKRRREPSRRRLGWRLAWWGSTHKKKALHLLGLRGRHQYLNQCSNRNRAPCVAPPQWGPRGRTNKWPDRHCREQLTEEGRKIIDEEKRTWPRTDPCGTPRRTRKERFLRF